MRTKLLCGALLAVFAHAGPAADIPDYPRIEFETTHGDFTVELDGRRAPLTVQHFVELVNEGFYAGTIFHRVIPGFAAQAGGYTPDYELKEREETIPNESGNGLSNQRGTIAMARLAAPHSANTQFYVNLDDNPRLDPSPSRWGYAVFGRVIEGMEVLEDIASLPTGPGGPLPTDVPAAPVIIERATLIDPLAATGE